MYRLMFICMGNICRSPLAHGMCESLALERGLALEVESSGTHGYHEGERADSRMRRVAAKHGLKLNSRSLTFCSSMAKEYDLLLLMDEQNYRFIKALLPQQLMLKKVRFLGDFDPQGQREVQDPYYGGQAAFEEVYQHIERCCCSLIEHLQKHGLQNT